MGTYVLFRLAGLLAPLVPRRLGYALMGVAARLMYRSSAANRRMIQANLGHIMGPEADEAEIDACARRVFHNLLKNYFDLFWLPAQKAERVAQMITVHGLEHVGEALTLGKGIIAVSAHLGNQEMTTQVKTITDRKLTVVAEHVKNERVFRYFSSLRQHSGIHLIPQDGALRDIFRALKRNEVIGLVADRDITETGRVIPFFGAPARLPAGYAVLTLKLGTPVVPAFVVRQPDDSYAAYIETPMQFQGSADNDDDVRRVMLSVCSVVERYVTKFVDQYVYFHYIWEDDKQRQAHLRKGTEKREE